MKTGNFEKAYSVQKHSVSSVSSWKKDWLAQSE